MSSLNRIPRFLARISVVLFLLLPGMAGAQTNLSKELKVEKGFSLPHYERKGDASKVLQCIFTGDSAIFNGTNQVLFKSFRMTTFADGDANKPQLIVETPVCWLDPNQHSHRASSTNRIRVSTVTTNLVLEGVGFSCTQTNELLVISNSVATRLPKPSGSHISAESLANSPANHSNFFQIFSDRFEFYYASNLVIYSGHVLVLDSNAQMKCEYLQARFNTNHFESIEQIIAERNITITTADQGKAWGDRAVYFVKPEGERIEVTGHARWEDGPRESKADQFTFDFTPDHSLRWLRGDGNVALKLPDSEIKDTNMMSTLPMSNLAGGTNHFTELFAEHVTITAGTNEGIESILAENQVVITNRFQQTRATGERAFYSKTNEQFELTGNPMWEAVSKGEIRADRLVVGRTNQTFEAHGNSRLKLVLSQFPDDKTLKFNVPKSSDTNHYLLVTSRDLLALTNMARFTGDVDARLLQGEHWLGNLKSQFLEIHFATNTLQSILAKEGVYGELAPQGQTLSRKVSSDLLYGEFWPGSRFLRNAKAEGNVLAEQVEKSKGTAKTKTTTLKAGSVVSQFAAVSNAVANAVATSNVFGNQVSGVATNTITGEHVVYTGTNETMVLTGNPKYFGPLPQRRSETNRPVALMPGETNAPSQKQPIGVMVTGADSLIWNLKTDNFRMTGPYRILPMTQTNGTTTTTQPASKKR